MRGRRTTIEPSDVNIKGVAMKCLVGLTAAIIATSGAPGMTSAQAPKDRRDSTEFQRRAADDACRKLPLRIQAYGGASGEYEIHRDPGSGEECTYRYGPLEPRALIVDDHLYCPESKLPKNGEWPASWPSVEPGTVLSMALTEDSLALARVHCSVTLRGLLTINTKKRRPKP
jgi:hypothetical protein